MLSRYLLLTFIMFQYLETILFKPIKTTFYFKSVPQGGINATYNDHTLRAGKYLPHCVVNMNNASLYLCRHQFDPEKGDKNKTKINYSEIDENTDKGDSQYEKSDRKFNQDLDEESDKKSDKNTGQESNKEDKTNEYSNITHYNENNKKVDNPDRTIENVTDDYDMKSEKLESPQRRILDSKINDVINTDIKSLEKDTHFTENHDENKDQTDDDDPEFEELEKKVQEMEKNEQANFHLHDVAYVFASSQHEHITHKATVESSYSSEGENNDYKYVPEIIKVAENEKNNTTIENIWKVQDVEAYTTESQEVFIDVNHEARNTSESIQSKTSVQYFETYENEDLHALTDDQPSKKVFYESKLSTAGLYVFADKNYVIKSAVEDSKTSVDNNAKSKLSTVGLYVLIDENESKTVSEVNTVKKYEYQTTASSSDIYEEDNGESSTVNTTNEN